MRERQKVERVRVRAEDNETVQSKLGDEARAALHAMVQAKQVEFHFGGKNPETGEPTRSVQIKAYPKLFSKLFWKVQVVTGDGRRERYEIHGEPDDIEYQLWRILETVEDDFQQLQRGEALRRRA